MFYKSNKYCQLLSCINAPIQDNKYLPVIDLTSRENVAKVRSGCHNDCQTQQTIVKQLVSTQFSHFHVNSIQINVVYEWKSRHNYEILLETLYSSTQVLWIIFFKRKRVTAVTMCFDQRNVLICLLTVNYKIKTIPGAGQTKTRILLTVLTCIS